MCEFCMQRGTNIGDSEFAGFFSTAAIEEAMALANKLRGGAAATTDNDGDDSDGT